MLLCYVVVPLLIAMLSILLLIYKELRALNALIAQKPTDSAAKPKLFAQKRRAARLTDKSRNWLDRREGKRREAV